MLRHVLVISLTLVHTVAPAHGSPAVEIHATCAAELAPDRDAHVRTMRRAIETEFAGLRASGYTIDVALVRLETASAGARLDVRAEVRALVSDGHGRIQWSTSARATAHGSERERGLLQRDAVAEAARQLGRSVRGRIAAR